MQEASRPRRAAWAGQGRQARRLRAAPVAQDSDTVVREVKDKRRTIHGRLASRVAERRGCGAGWLLDYLSWSPVSVSGSSTISVARRAPSPVSVTAASLAAPVSPTRPSLVDLGYFGPGTGTWTGACRVGVPTACLRVARRRRRHIKAACEHAASLRGRRRGWRRRDGGGGGGGGGERRHGARRPRRRLGPGCLPIRQSGAAHDSQKIRIRSLRIRSFKCCGPQVRCGARDEMTPLESVRPLALFKARVARRLCAPSLAVWQRGGLGARISTRHTRLSCPWRLGCQHATDITQTHQTLLPACSRWIASTSLLRGVSA